MDRIVKQIENGPGELDIVIDILRRTSHHPRMTFDGREVPVFFKTLGVDEGRWEEDVVVITGNVMLHHLNRHRYHGFRARYNVRKRKGEAEFETECAKCGAEVNEWGMCVKCDPCPQCGRSNCQPHHSCQHKCHGFAQGKH